MTLPSVALLLLLLLGSAAAGVEQPYQLQVNYQRAPALGVGPNLRFSWAVPATNATQGVQTKYHIVVTDLDTSKVAWDSGIVASAASINIALDAKVVGLKPGAAYSWTVACDARPASAPATFITALWDGFDSSANWIWASNTKTSQHYAFFRHELTSTSVSSSTAAAAADPPPPMKPIKRALLFATSWVEPTMLAAYKFYVNGNLVSIGPGRGEAQVSDGNSTFMHAPYTTTDITKHFPAQQEYEAGDVAPVVLAIEGMAPLYQTPCLLHVCKDVNTNGGGVLAQVHLTFMDGTSAVVTTSSRSWKAVPADTYFNPTALTIDVWGIKSETAYAKVLENTDARQEAHLHLQGWKEPTYPSHQYLWPWAEDSFYQAHDQLVATMARPMQVFNVPAASIVPATGAGASSTRTSSTISTSSTSNTSSTAPSTTASSTTATTFNDNRVAATITRSSSSPSSFLVDYGREFQGGVILTVADGTDGTIARMVSGELLLQDGATDKSTGSRIDPANTWGYELTIVHQHALLVHRTLTCISSTPHTNMHFEGTA
jgi:hypothetical protein